MTMTSSLLRRTQVVEKRIPGLIEFEIVSLIWTNSDMAMVSLRVIFSNTGGAKNDFQKFGINCITGGTLRELKKSSKEICHMMAYACGS